MSDNLTEKKVLKKLGVNSFNEITKNKVISMGSMLDKMDPEVAKKALEQFPNFSQTVQEITKDYKDTLDKNVQSNDKSVQEYYGVCKSIIATLEKMALDENLTFDEKKYIIEKMLEVERMINVKDSENKAFIKTMSTIGLIALAVPVMALTTLVGATTDIKLKK